MNAPIARKIKVICSDLGIESVRFYEGPLHIEGPSHLAHLIHEWLEAYKHSKELPPLPFHFSDKLTPFCLKVLEGTQNIPWGSTVSYGELAAQVGCPSGARAVGNALNRNPIPLFIPCHRVIHSNGSLGGFGYGPYYKRELLAHEGVIL